MCNQYKLKTANHEIAAIFAGLQAPLSFPEGAPNVEPRDVISITDRADSSG